MAVTKKRVVPFQMVIAALLDESSLFPPSYLHRFSDLGETELAELQKIWQKVNPARRIALLEDLEELAEIDTLVSFDVLARFALTDPDPAAREIAIRLLWENQDAKLAPIYMEMLNNDTDASVRAAAASALGLFVYLGELEEFPAEALKTIEDQLLQTYHSSDQPIVRRRALEALGYSSREVMGDLIQSAYDTEDSEWLASALFAMGRSMDPRWETPILEMLQNPDVRVQTEAVRAAGQLELAAARLPLLELLDDEQDVDEEVSAAAIWSLSQIGGESVRERLEELQAATDDEDEIEYLDRALENLNFTEDFEVFEMFDFDSTENDQEDTLDDDSDETQASR